MAEDTPVEIERKFLVVDDTWRAVVECAGAGEGEGEGEGERIVQGYLSTDRAATVRIRVGDRGSFLTIKGVPDGLTTPEFEYPIPRAHAEAMLRMCGEATIEKTRYRIPVEGHTFEVDVFEGANAGLVVAEIELEREDQAFPRPGWLGLEVSLDPRFKNVRLAHEPFRPDWTFEG